MSEPVKRRPGRPRKIVAGSSYTGSDASATPAPGGLRPSGITPARNGETVAAFEAAFAQYVGARYAVAFCNATAALHAALVACGVGKDTPVRVPPLTMSSTTIAVLLAGGRPVFTDVDAETWTMFGVGDVLALPVSLYGLHYDHGRFDGPRIDDAAQTLRPHDPRAAFTSYSFQASKILSTGEGGMLVTDDPDLAQQAREFGSLGYHMEARQPRIDPAVLKDPGYLRHYGLAPNYRMADAVAAVGLQQLAHADDLLAERFHCASLYRDVLDGCAWLRPQQGAPHDRWAYAFALPRLGMWQDFAVALERHGGERPYAAWALPWNEPGIKPHVSYGGECPNAEDLQPRILQLQTNGIEAAKRNADALAAAIKEVGG